MTQLHKGLVENRPVIDDFSSLFSGHVRQAVIRGPVASLVDSIQDLRQVDGDWQSHATLSSVGVLVSVEVEGHAVRVIRVQQVGINHSDLVSLVESDNLTAGHNTLQWSESVGYFTDGECRGAVFPI